MSSDADTPKIPGYELTGPLGEGGQASVYLGTQLSMHRSVAVKVILPGAAEGSTELGRFLREARVLARMRHENIVQAIDFGEAEGVRYLVMEHVDGTEVLDLIKSDEGINVQTACDIAAQVSRALAHASQFDVIHRDIKPANIIITGKGRAVLVDFGLARPEEGDPDLQVTMAGMSVGTPHYMPPEQIRGVDQLDQRVDIYGLGGTFYHMLTGRPPFQKRDKTQILIAHLKDPVVLPENMEKEIPDYVFAIVKKSMEKDRDQRYQHPEEMTKDLEVALNRLKGVAKRPRRRTETPASTRAPSARRVEKLKADREQLVAEVEALRQRQEEIRKKAQEIIHRKNRELEQGRSQVLALQEKLDVALSGTDSAEALNEQIKKLGGENAVLAERLTGAEGFVREFEKKVQVQEETATRQLGELAEERDSLRESIEESEKRVLETRALGQKAKEERDLLRTERDGLKRRIEELETGSGKAETKVPAPAADDRFEKLTQKLAAAQTAVSLLESERDELRNNRRMLRTRLDELGQQLRDLELKQDTERRDLTEKIRQAEELAATQEAVPIPFAEFEDDDVMVADVTDADDISGELDREVQEAQEHFEAAKAKLEVERDSLIAERDEALAAALEFEEKCQATEKALADADLQGERDRLIAERDEALAKARELEEGRKTAEKALADADLQGERDRLIAERDEALAKARELEGSKKTAEQALADADLQGERDRLIAERDEALAKAREVEKKLEGATAGASEELERVRREADEKLLGETERVRAEAEQQAAATGASASGLEEKLTAADQARTEAEERLKAMAGQLEQVREEADRSEEALREKLTELVRENMDLSEQLEGKDDEEDDEPPDAALQIVQESYPEGVDVRTESPKDAVVPARSAPMAFISRGEFTAGVDEGANMDTPRRTVNVASFWVDVYPVTNRQFSEFVKATGRNPPSHWPGPEAPVNFIDHPVVLVTWADAAAYAEWCGKRLPTPVEWQKAARGTDGRAFPWGDEWETHRLNSKEEGPNRTTPVGVYRRGPSPYGVYDAAGNVTEWVEGEFKTSGSQIIRPVCSGSWRDPLGRSQCAARRGYPDGGKAPYVGFRCARDA